MSQHTAGSPLTARGLLLDMDGTLVNSDAVVERVWRRWSARQGLDAEKVLEVAHGRQADATMELVLPGRPDAVNQAEKQELLAEETADTRGVVPVPGAAAFLAALAPHAHALVTSAGSGLARARMDAAGLPMPALRVTAEGVSRSKPDPEGFLKGAEVLGLAPADCVVFEDSAAGVAAAHAAGMRVVGVGPRAAEHQPTVHVTDLEPVRLAPHPDGLRLYFGG